MTDLMVRVLDWAADQLAGADDLSVSLETAKRVMHNLRTKLGASNRAQAVAIGFARGYLQVTRSGK